MLDKPTDSQPTEPEAPDSPKADGGGTAPSFLDKAKQAITDITEGGSAITASKGDRPALYVDTEQPADSTQGLAMLGEDRLAAEWAAAVAESPYADQSTEQQRIEESSDGPLKRKLELAEEFRQIGDIYGARELLEEVVEKDEEGAYGSCARKMLGQLNQDSDVSLDTNPTYADDLPGNTESLEEIEQQEKIDADNDKIDSDQMFRIAEFPELAAVGGKLYSGDLYGTFPLLIRIGATSDNPELKTYANALLSKIRTVTGSFNALRGALKRYSAGNLSIEDIRDSEERYAVPARRALADLYTTNTDTYKRLRNHLISL